MPTKSQRKGKRVEYLIRDLLKTLGECERVPCSGNARAFKGDLIFTHNGQTYKVEIKARKTFSPMRWFKSADILIVKPDRTHPVVMMSLKTLQKLVNK